MFTVRWMREDRNEPVETESFYLTSLDRIVARCKADLLARTQAEAPDGFVVCRDGAEVRRWFGPSHGESAFATPSPRADADPAWRARAGETGRGSLAGP